ncbi:hypothetical protein PR048_013472 [Dryococelus australis]|uniref:DUF4371 domain-containing protein n=1 Tax=Dryococelus australis TaxID=614101 RepID=A0ABQ9HSP7_9NEOP|nr:hypothetical protein PR048_013472 [Dryococelus australis]
MTLKKKRVDYGVKKERACFAFLAASFRGIQESESFRQSKLFSTGYSENWRRIHEKVKHIESHSLHISNCMKWEDLSRALRGTGGIYSKKEKNVLDEIEKWCKVLRNLIDVMLFLAKHGLRFRGSHCSPEHEDYELFMFFTKFIAMYDKHMDFPL